MKTIIIGLGNPILGDDGVGWKVAEEVKRLLALTSTPAFAMRTVDVHDDSRQDGESYIDVEFLALGGISLMENLIGYERAILIDAVTSDQATGAIIVSNLSEMPDHSALHISSAHDTSLQNALKLGKAMGAKLPGEIVIVGVATNQIYDFSEELSPPVAGAVAHAAKIVISLLG